MKRVQYDRIRRTKLDILLSVMTFIRQINIFSSTGYFVFMMLMLPSTIVGLLGTTAPGLGTRGNTFNPSSQFFMVNPGVKAPPDIEREVSRLGKSGRTDEAISLYHSASRPKIRLLNGAIDACSRARPPRLEQAFELLTDGVENKSLQPNVFTFGSLISACARARNADLAMKVLRSMEVSCRSIQIFTCEFLFFTILQKRKNMVFSRMLLFIPQSYQHVHVKPLRRLIYTKLL
jgi:pentatricopeptide repeat protein